MAESLDRWILFGFLSFAALVFGIAVYSVLSAPTAEERTEVAEKSARRWADRVGLRVTGISCVRDRCAVGVEGAGPVLVSCGAETCTLESCK